MKTIITKVFVAVLITAVLLASASSGAVFARETLESQKALATFGSPAVTTTWDLPWGLDADPTSVNIWTYPTDAVAVTLADVEDSMPPGLLIWHYGGPTEGWRFYKKGWGAVNTLTALVPGGGYVGIVPTASVWEIRPGAAASAIIGPAGGAIEITDPSSPLYGTTVEIPEDALERDIRVAIISAPQNAPFPEALMSAGNGIEVVAESTVFSYAVSITVPYSDRGINEDTIGVYRYDASDGSWKMTPLESVDTVQNTVTVQTLTFSTFYPLALSEEDQIAPQSSLLLFDPDRDGLATPNVYNCYGEVSFVQWFWENGEGDLADWHRDEHWEIAEMAQCALWRENDLGRYRHSRDIDGYVAISLMLSLDKFPKPQIVGYTFPDAMDPSKTAGHAILVYGYRTVQPAPIEVEFYTYDPDTPSKTSTMTYDGQSLHYRGNGYIKGFVPIGTPDDTDAVEFVYEYIKRRPEITDLSPTGGIDDRRPTISAAIYYPFIATDSIDYIPKVEMKLNGKVIVPIIEHVDNHNIRISYTPLEDLPAGLYEVYLSGEGFYSKGPPGDGFCAPPIEEKDWTFVIGGGWCFTFYNHLPAIYLYVDPVEIYYVDEDYGPVAPFGMDIDFNEIPELASLGQLWYAPVPEEPICIEVAREGDNIAASFEFTHEPTGYDVSAELSGTIIDSAVGFNINYYLPDGLQNYSMPLHYSDCMSEMEGTVYYSLPAVLTVNYQGTIVGDTIQGAFQTVIGNEWARWRYHDKEYACVVTILGPVRDELLFNGLVEWRLSNLRLSGDFRVDIGG
jgi:hypothetical protein